MGTLRVKLRRKIYQRRYWRSFNKVSIIFFINLSARLDLKKMRVQILPTVILIYSSALGTNLLRRSNGLTDNRSNDSNIRLKIRHIACRVPEHNAALCHKETTLNKWPIPFYFSYNAIKTWIQGGNARTPLGPGLHMLAAAQAGILSLIMTNPIWVVKTRLCLQYSEATIAENKRYTGMVDGLTKIYRTEGVRGLYRVSDFSLILV